MPKPSRDFTSAPMPEVEAELGYCPDGLSTAEATRRLARYGPNEIAEHKTKVKNAEKNAEQVRDLAPAHG
jgi:hypothetical protein